MLQHARCPLLISILLGLFLIANSPPSANAYERISLSTSDQHDGPSLTITERGTTALTLQFDLPFLDSEEVLVAGQQYRQLSFPGSEYTGKDGQHALPEITYLVAIPRGATTRIRIVDTQQHTLAGIEPVYNLADDQDSPELSRHSSRKSDQSAADHIAVGTPAMINGIQIVPVTVRPLAYEADQREVTAVHGMTAELEIVGGGGRTGIQRPDRPIPESFARLISAQVMNIEFDAQDVVVGSYLVVCPDDQEVIDILEPLLDWRRRQGYTVVLATTSEAGTNVVQIKDYIQNAFDNWPVPLEFVCIAGDATGDYTVPTWFEALSYWDGEGDHYYTTLAGDDMLSDIHIGRLCYQTTLDLETQVDKIVAYESDPYIDNPAWFKRASLVGDPTTSGQSCVLVNQWLKDELLEMDYAEVDTIWSGNFPIEMMDSFDAGNTVLTYRGLGGTSGFTHAHAAQLYNRRRLPFATLITCGTGNFAEGNFPSLVEMFQNNPLGGSVAIIGMSTNGTHTRYNNCLFHGIWDGALHLDDYRVGPALTCGKMNMYDNYHLSEPDIVEIWSCWANLLGDPATEIWTDIPTPLAVTHPDLLPVGASSISLTVADSDGSPLSGARVAIYKADEILVSGHTDAQGAVILSLSGHTTGPAHVTVTSHNRIPYQETVTLGGVDSFLDCTDLIYEDDNTAESSGNGNGQLEPGETIEIECTVTNLGTEPADGISITLATGDPWVTILTGTTNCVDLAAGASAQISTPLVVSLGDHSPIARNIPLLLTATTAADSWVSLVQLPLPGAQCVTGGLVFSGSADHLEPGDLGTLSIELLNSGADPLASGATAVLRCDNSLVTVTDSTGTYGAIAAGGQGTNLDHPFAVAVSAMCFPGMLASFSLQIEFAEGGRDTLVFQTNIGTASADDPVGPDQHGYYAIDSTDYDYPQHPRYDWIEIDPELGGEGTRLRFLDNAQYQDHTIISDLPFPFTYYGNTFETVSICSNGWIALGDTYLTNYRNWALPGPGSPDNMIAVNWDNLMLVQGSGIFVWHDEVEHRYIIEWGRMQHQDFAAHQTFEIILYDPAYHPTSTGDGLFVCQYNTFTLGNSFDGYNTVGIQNGDHSDGLTCTYFNEYAAGAARLVSGLAIAFRPMDQMERGLLQGQITNNANGEPLSDVEIRILGDERTMTTDTDGHFQGAFATSTIDLAVWHQSCDPDTLTDVQITAGEITEVEFILTDVSGPEFGETTHLNSREDTAGPYYLSSMVSDLTEVEQPYLYYTSSSSGGPFCLPMTLAHPDSNRYCAEIPGQDFGSRINYWIVCQDVLGNQTCQPENAPWQSYNFHIVTEDVLFSFDMETESGWIGGDPEDDAESGVWERVDPNPVYYNSFLIQTGDDHGEDDHTMCWVTGNDPAGADQGTDDVDGGQTTLLSPWMNLEGCQGVSCSFFRWYTNNTGPNPLNDRWLTQVTNDGLNWIDLENTSSSARIWLERSYLLNDFLDLTSTMRFRFIASDDDLDSIIEAAVDDFILSGFPSLQDETPPSVELLSPSANEVISVDEGTYPITWAAEDDLGIVHTHVVLSTDGGLSWPDTLASGPYNNSFDWQPPAITAYDCRIKIVCLDASQKEASVFSMADFAIDQRVASGPPETLHLAQNLPNPFNPRTEIRFAVSGSQHVLLEIYDVAGKLVTTLADQVYPAGNHFVIWMGTDRDGRAVASGTYFSRLISEDRTLTRKMMLVR